MKTILKKFWAPALLCLLLLGATSCVDSYDSVFYDSNLLGSWTLTGVNYRPVSGTEANAFRFLPNGKGIYYYYSQGEPQQMNINWYCDMGNSGVNTFIFIQYLATGNNATCQYWFRSNQLYMMFYSNGRQMIYQYTYKGRDVTPELGPL